MTPSVPITTELEQSMSSFYTDQGQIQKEEADEIVGEAQEPHPPSSDFLGLAFCCKGHSVNVWELSFALYTLIRSG